jgi:hypothetical protein
MKGELKKALQVVCPYCNAQVGTRCIYPSTGEEATHPHKVRLNLAVDSKIEITLSKLSWKSLKDDPPGPEHRTFFVGHSKGGRMDYIFRWPDLNGKMAFWVKGYSEGNRILTGYTPDIWYPGPPLIVGSDVEAIQQGRMP